MAPEVSAALIAAIAAVVVALVGFFTALSTQRATARNNVEIERFRAELGKTAWVAQLSERRFRDELAAHIAAMQSIQRMRDELRRLVKAGDRALLAREASERLNHAAQQLAVDYQEQHPHLTPEVVTVWHAAKNAADLIAQQCAAALDSCRYTSELAEPVRSAAVESLARLTDAHETMRNHKQRFELEAARNALENRH